LSAWILAPQKVARSGAIRAIRAKRNRAASTSLDFGAFAGLIAGSPVQLIYW